MYVSAKNGNNKRLYNKFRRIRAQKTFKDMKQARNTYSFMDF